MDLVDISKGLPKYLRDIQRAGVFPKGSSPQFHGSLGNRIAANSYGQSAGKRLKAAYGSNTQQGFKSNAEGFATLTARGREAKETSTLLGRSGR